MREVRHVLYFALVEFDLPGGPVVHTMNMVKGFRQIGVECTVVCPQPRRQPPPIEGVEFVYVRPFAWSGWKRWITNLCATLQLMRAIARCKPDMLYFRDHTTNTLPTWLARAAGIPLIIEMNGRVPEDFPRKGSLWRRLRDGWHRLRRRSQFESAEGITFNSPGLQQAYVSAYRLDASRTDVVTMHVDPEIFFPRPRLDCRRELSLPGNAVIVGYVGTFHPSHELESVLDAVRRLNREGTPCLFLTVGDGERRRQVQNAAQRMGVEEHVIFAGWVPHSMVSVYLSAMDLGLAFLTRERGFAVEGLLKVKEYLACGIPVLVNSGHQELFDGYPEGAVIAVDASDDVATGPLLAEVIRSHADHRDSLVARVTGSRFVHENFGLDAAATRTLEVAR